jgi:hypothetical protein
MPNTLAASQSELELKKTMTRDDDDVGDPIRLQGMTAEADVACKEATPASADQQTD